MAIERDRFRVVARLQREAACMDVGERFCTLAVATFTVVDFCCFPGHLHDP